MYGTGCPETGCSGQGVLRQGVLERGVLRQGVYGTGRLWERVSRDNFLWDRVIVGQGVFWT